MAFNLNEINEEENDIKIETQLLNNIKNKKKKEDIEKAIDSPTYENYDKAIKIINEEKFDLSQEDKTLLRKGLFKLLVKKYNLYNCPDSYEDLKKEAKELSDISKYSFVLMAQRLKKIRDEELYKIEYQDFETFLHEEMNASRRHAYNYINLIEVFGVQALAQKENIDHSKLIIAVPLINKLNDEEEKEKIKIKIINDAGIKSYRDMLMEIKELKEKYGISKAKVKKQINIKQEAEKFEELLIGNQTNIDFIDKEALTHLVHTIERLLKKGY